MYPTQRIAIRLQPDKEMSNDILLSTKEFVVRADFDKDHDIVVLMIEDRTIIAGDVDTPIAEIFSMKRMVIEEHMIRFVFKET